MLRALSNERISSTASAHQPLSVIQPVTDAIAALPSTRYYGSKRKLLPWIYENIRSLQFETALDLFGGTASVSLLFKTMRKTVTYHDGLRFNQDVGRTLLASEIAMSRAEVVEFLHRVKPKNGIISKEFRGIYYTAQENSWLDGFSVLLEDSALSSSKSSLLRYLVYQACLKKRPFNLFHRANLHLRTNGGIKRSFGNSTTWERSFEHHMLQAYDELSPSPCYQKEGIILPSQNAENIPAGHDLVYIDPPYINLEDRYNADDYWRRYHFLEGLACYKDWDKRIDPLSRIKLLNQPQWMINWSRRKTFTQRLFALIKKHRNSIVVLSYVTKAHPNESEIRAFFETQFSNVSLHTKKHNHALSSSPRRELLFVGRPR